MRSVTKSRCSAMFRRHFWRFPEGRASEFRVYVGGTLSNCAPISKTARNFEGISRCVHHFRQAFSEGRIGFSSVRGGWRAAIFPLSKGREISGRTLGACVIFGKFFEGRVHDFQACVGVTCSGCAPISKGREIWGQTPDACVISASFSRGVSMLSSVRGG